MSGGMSQDQDMASSLSGDLVVVLNGAVADDKTGVDSKLACSNNGTESKTLEQVEPQIELQVEHFSGPKLADIANDGQGYRQGNWLPSETIVLLEAKRKEQDMFAAYRRSILTVDDKWKFVSDYCRKKGVHRSKEQCRFKWDNMLADYRKIKEHEEQKDAAGEPSYFDMVSWQRKAKMMPSNMDLELYQQIASIMSKKPTKGGLKREARERKFLEMGDVRAGGARKAAKGVEMGGYGKPWEENMAMAMAMADTGNKQIQFTMSPRRRKKRSMVEKVHADPESRNTSSTEEDITVMPGRCDGHTSPCSFYRDMHAFSSQRITLQASCIAQNRPFNLSDAGAENVATTSPQEDNSARSADFLTYIENRKDARHNERLALEREKLAVFKEASFTIATAMTNAIAVFSKVAEELLLRR